MRGFNKPAVAALTAVSLIVGLGSVAAQDDPTPPPWSQATIDAAIDSLLTQTAAAPPGTAQPDAAMPEPTRDPLASDTLTGLSADYEPINAANFDQLEVVGEFDFDADYVITHPIAFGQNHRWIAVDQFDERRGDDLAQLTVSLIDRWQPELPPRSIVIEEPTNHDEYPTLDVQGDHLLYFEGMSSVVVYDINSGERLGRLVEPVEFVALWLWVDENRAVGFMENDELVIWDLATQTVEQRWPTPRGIVYGVVLQSSGIALVYERNGRLSAIDLEMGEILEEWESDRERYPFASARTDIFYVSTFDGDVTLIDNDTLQTVGRSGIGRDELLFVSPDARFLITVGDDDAVSVWEFERERRITTFSDWQVIGLDMNRAGDLIMLYEDAYHFYALFEDGVEPLELPDDLAESDGLIDVLNFLFGEQLMSAHYSRRFDKVQITLWGVRS